MDPGSKLSERRLTLSLAESCTGGLASDMVTDVPGSSAYFLAGLVTYSNEAKVRLLGVNETTLRTHGAVSEETAREMAEGVRKVIGSDIGASTTGIAGPGGATPTKPAGLVHFAVSWKGGMMVDRVVFPGGRRAVKVGAAEHILRMVDEAIDRL